MAMPAPPFSTTDMSQLTQPFQKVIVAMKSKRLQSVSNRGSVILVPKN